MPQVLLIVLLIACAGVVFGGSIVLARGLDRLGCNLDLSAGWLGLITALGANSPELTSAFSSVLSGSREMGLGVVIGSNIFNLAALLGLSAVLTGRMRIRRAALTLDGGVSVFATLVILGLALHLLSAVAALALLATVFLLYVVVSGLRSHRLADLPLPDFLTNFLKAALAKPDQTQKKREEGRSWRPVWWALPALAVIIGGSIGMVKTALALASAWSLPHALVGSIVLAALTGLPNAYTATHLARSRRSAAASSEAWNSNTLNLLAGIAVPALIFGLSQITAGAMLELWWLLGMTLAAISLSWRGGISRAGGWTLIVLYLLFVALRVGQFVAVPTASQKISSGRNASGADFTVVANLGGMSTAAVAGENIAR